MLTGESVNYHLEQSQKTGREIFSAIMQASYLLNRFRPKSRLALEYLEPYMDIEKIDGLSEPSSKNILALYSAAVADCYREMSEVNTAAKWYKRASVFNDSYGFAKLYAKMVIEHKLSEYYENALMCLQKSNSEWEKYPLYKRFYFWMITLGHHLKQPWNIPELLLFNFRSKRFEKQLKLLLSSKAG